MSKRIPVVGPIAPFSGYGMLVEALVKGFLKLGYEPSYRSFSQDKESFGAKLQSVVRSCLVDKVQPEPFELVVHTPEHPHTHGKRIIHYTMWESTRLSHAAVQNMNGDPGRSNAVDAIITPSQWGSSCFSAQGIDAAIFVVPLGLNPIAYNWEPMNMDGPCIFGCGGRMAHGGARKGVNEVIELFQKAFPTEQDVKLRVKVFTDCPVKVTDDPRVEMYVEFLPEMQLANWFKEITAFISLARGEGWGLFQHQSMACGRPVVACRYAGLAEFMTERNSYCIDYRQRDPKVEFYKGMGKWAEWNPDSAIAHMRDIYRDRTKAALKGKEAMEDVKHLTWENTAIKTLEVIKQTGFVS